MTRDLTHELSLVNRYGKFRHWFCMPLSKVEALTDILIVRGYIKEFTGPEPPANGGARRARDTARVAGWFLATVAERHPRTDGRAVGRSSPHVQQTMWSAALFWGQAEQTHTSASGTGVLAIFFPML